MRATQRGRDPTSSAIGEVDPARRTFNWAISAKKARPSRLKGISHDSAFVGRLRGTQAVNENDNNKNRRYEVVDSRVRKTYTADSKATNKNALSDPYVKAWRWASDRIGKEGIVAYVCNNSFIDDIAFDGVRKHFARDFETLYVLNLGGNVRKNPKLSGTTHNVFGIQVGVSVNIFVRKERRNGDTDINYHAVPIDWRRGEKTQFLEQARNHCRVGWHKLRPNKRNHWLTSELGQEFDDFVPLAAKEGTASGSAFFFRRNGRGVATSRDNWAYNFDAEQLATQMRRTTEFYSAELERLRTRTRRPKNMDEFVHYEDTKLKWSRDLKEDLEAETVAKFDKGNIRRALYRPFTRMHLYFDRIFNEEVYQFPDYFPNENTERENLVIAVTGIGSEKPFMVFAANSICDLHLVGAGAQAQCFPFYTYDGDDGARRENIPLSILVKFQQHYDDERITKWDIFHYVYAVLHHPEYRARYAANLRRELPRFPLIGKDAKTFHAFAEIGRKLADLHVNYEDAAEHKLKRIENRDEKLNWRVEKMRLTKDKRAIIYNEFLTLDGIPPETFNYRLGNRSALEWVIDQYQVSIDKRSGITNDPNRDDELDYIVKLVGKVISVSLGTQKLIAALPPLELGL